MAKCGIKKYDILPARVGWTDVDYLRYQLAHFQKLANMYKEKLEQAYKKHKNG